MTRDAMMADAHRWTVGAVRAVTVAGRVLLAGLYSNTDGGSAFLLHDTRAGDLLGSICARNLTTSGDMIYGLVLDACGSPPMPALKSGSALHCVGTSARVGLARAHLPRSASAPPRRIASCSRGSGLAARRGTAGAWFVERRPDGATWKPGAHQADVTVTGPARSLLLTLTRRLPLTDREATNIRVGGDTDLAQHWLDNTAHIAD